MKNSVRTNEKKRQPVWFLSVVIGWMVLIGKLGMESSDVAFVDVVDEASVGTDETNQGLKK